MMSSANSVTKLLKSDIYMGFDKGDKFIDDAKQRAHDAIGESNPKLTSLEKGFLHAMKRRQAREKHARKGN